MLTENEAYSLLGGTQITEEQLGQIAMQFPKYQNYVSQHPNCTVGVLKWLVENSQDTLAKTIAQQRLGTLPDGGASVPTYQPKQPVADATVQMPSQAPESGAQAAPTANQNNPYAPATPANQAPTNNTGYEPPATAPQGNVNPYAPASAANAPASAGAQGPMGGPNAAPRGPMGGPMGGPNGGPNGGQAPAKKRTGLIIGIIVAVVALVIVSAGGFGAYYFLSGKKASPKAKAAATKTQKKPANAQPKPQAGSNSDPNDPLTADTTQNGQKILKADGTPLDISKDGSDIDADPGTNLWLVNENIYSLKGNKLEKFDTGCPDCHGFDSVKYGFAIGYDANTNKVILNLRTKKKLNIDLSQAVGKIMSPDLIFVNPYDNVSETIAYDNTGKKLHDFKLEDYDSMSAYGYWVKSAKYTGDKSTFFNVKTGETKTVPGAGTAYKFKDGFILVSYEQTFYAYDWNLKQLESVPAPGTRIAPALFNSGVTVEQAMDAVKNSVTKQKCDGDACVGFNFVAHSDGKVDYYNSQKGLFAQNITGTKYNYNGGKNCGPVLVYTVCSDTGDKATVFQPGNPDPIGQAAGLTANALMTKSQLDHAFSVKDNNVYILKP